MPRSVVPARRPAHRRTPPPPRRRRDSPARALLRFCLCFSVALALFLAVGLGVGLTMRSLTGDRGGPQAASSGAPAPATPQPVTVDLSGLNSPCAILIARGGPVLGQLDAHRQIPPASLTKMMTVLLAAENLPDLDAPVTLEEEIFPPLWAANASMAGFLPGETVTVRDLMYGALLPSGAECCVALARQVSGSEQDFVQLMNRKAEELGLTDTHFCNATGLQDPEHLSTAADLAALLDAALDNDDFRRVFTTHSYTAAPTDQHPDGLTLESSLFASLTGDTVGAVTLLGGKTGYTDEAGLCLATLASCGDSEYILVTAGAPGDNHSEPLHVEDARTVYQRLSDQLGG